LVVPKIVFSVPSVPVSGTGQRRDDSNFYFLITSTHDIYYDVRKPYKNAYTYRHIRKGYRGIATANKSHKGLQQTNKNYK
jgi:hypothetical protein